MPATRPLSECSMLWASATSQSHKQLPCLSRSNSGSSSMAPTCSLKLACARLSPPSLLPLPISPRFKPSSKRAMFQVPAFPPRKPDRSKLECPKSLANRQSSETLRIKIGNLFYARLSLNQVVIYLFSITFLTTSCRFAIFYAYPTLNLPSF